MVWSPDGEWLAVTGRPPPGDPRPLRGHITVYDGAGRVAGEVWEAEDVGVGRIRFSPDGRRIVGARYPGDAPPGVHTWDWRTGELLDSIEMPDTRGLWLSQGLWLSDDGSLAASVLVGERIAVLDVASGRQVAVLAGQTGDTLEIAFSRDNATVAVGGSDGSVRLWDARDGDEIVTLEGHIGGVSALSFRRDGSQLASASFDGTVQIWALHLDDLEAIARDKPTRGLTHRRVPALSPRRALPLIARPEHPTGRVRSRRRGGWPGGCARRCRSGRRSRGRRCRRRWGGGSRRAGRRRP